jgi:hypothetical protein
VQLKLQALLALPALLTLPALQAQDGNQILDLNSTITKNMQMRQMWEYYPETILWESFELKEEELN